MVRYGKRIQFLAIGLSALAGFVDAIGFLTLGGFFVSFMSGNTTRFAVGLAEGTPPAYIAGGLIGLFVLGVMLGSLAGHFAGRHRAVIILALVTALLVLSAAFGTAGFMLPAIIAMTLAMGAENAIFAEAGDVHIGLTYMTGTLVKFGQRLTAALLGGDRLSWLPYLLLWLGLAAGAVAGALAYPHLGLDSLWLAAGAAALFTVAMLFARPSLSGQTA
jgi:uncharacterized membrane protein YoaK (UPF0700 family)